MASAALKKNYRCSQSLQQFYTGGPYAVSSDGSFIVCACDDTIKVVDSSNASIKSTIEGDSEPVTSLTLSPDDKFLFSASHSRQIRVWDLSSLKCLRSWKVMPWKLYFLLFTFFCLWQTFSWKFHTSTSGAWGAGDGHGLRCLWWIIGDSRSW